MKLLFLILATFTLVFSLSCGPPQLPTGPKVTPPGSGEGGKYQCKDVTGSTDPWLVEWDPTAKVRFQSKAKKGVLLVKYSGCNLEVLYGCEVEGQYEFTATTRSSQTEYINNEDELFAKLPIGALNLVSQFNQGDRWALDYVVVGTQDANVNQIERADLSGRCAEATHFVQGMAVGAYQLGSEAHRKGGAEATLYGVGAGGSSGSAAGNLRQDGHYQKCVGDEMDSNDQGCQAIVQLYLEPIAGAILTPVIQCPAGSKLINGGCVSTEAVNVSKIMMAAAEARGEMEGSSGLREGGGQTDLGARILRLPEGGSDGWDDLIKRILVKEFDKNNSDWIDTTEEVSSIPCDVFISLDRSIRNGRGESAALRTTYGFPQRFRWVGSALGFDEKARADADARLENCGL